MTREESPLDTPWIGKCQGKKGLTSSRADGTIMSLYLAKENPQCLRISHPVHLSKEVRRPRYNHLQGIEYHVIVLAAEHPCTLHT